MAEIAIERPDPVLERIERLAAQRADAEVMNLLQSRPDLVERRHDVRVVAAALRQARKQFQEQFGTVGAVPAVTALVEFAATIARPYPLDATFPADPHVREYLNAAIDWHETLRATPYVERFWDALHALSRADLGALFDLRGRVIGLVAEVGLETELPAPLEAFVMGFLRKPWLLPEPHHVLSLLAYGMLRYGAAARLRDLVCELFQDWCHYFAAAEIHTIDRLRHLYRLRDRIHAQLAAALLGDPLWSRRFGTPAMSAALFIVRLGQKPFFRSPSFIKLYGMRRWLQTTRVVLGWLARRRFIDAPPTASGRVTGTAADILVTRAQGGLGDIMTMRPGLIALAQANRRGRVVFATKRGHFALFSVDDPIELVDIEAAPIDHHTFGRWIDLSACPGARVEIVQYPKVRTQRIDIFATALGVRFSDARTQRLRPIRFAPDLAARADAFLQAHGPADKPAIGIQLRAADTYKDFPALLEVARELATRYRVFVFDNRPIGRRPEDGFVAVTDLPFGVVMAIAAKLDAIVTPDSALLHLAGANGVPCVGIFGPTDGRLHAAVYPSLRVVDLSNELPCIPCWRSEFMKCELSDSYRSVCLHELPQPTVVAALEQLLPKNARGESAIRSS
jgi:hypothetical protein